MNNSLTFKNVEDTTVTVRDEQGNVLFSADVMELEALLALSQRNNANTLDRSWLPKFAEEVEKKYGAKTSPANAWRLATLVSEAVANLKN